MKQTLYNIYYINSSKVYEIKMMLSNTIVTNREEQEGSNHVNDNTFSGGFNFGFKELLSNFGFNVEGTHRNTQTDSQRVIEKFEIKTTKSIILREVIQRSKEVSDLTNINEGMLIKIDNVKLSLLNETELRTAKLFTSGSMKGIHLPGIEGVDSDKVVNSMLKNYAYKIRGHNQQNTEGLIIKIPLSFENEFESDYGIDDLFIGQVSLVGLYKGKVKPADLKNDMEYFQDISNQTELNSVSGSEYGISESQPLNETTHPEILNQSEYNNEDHHYIDLLAIIQNVIIPAEK